MKKLIITALLFVVAVSTGYAQLGTGVDQTFTANATVLATITITKVSDLNFDDVIPGDNKTVEISGGAATQTYGTSDLAQFTIAGSATKEVGAYLTTNPATLSDGGTNTLPIGTWVAWTDPAAATATATTYSDPTSWANRALVVLGAGGAGTMWVGATVSPPGTQAAGTYQSDNTITFWYTGN